MCGSQGNTKSDIFTEGGGMSPSDCLVLPRGHLLSGLCVSLPCPSQKGITTLGGWGADGRGWSFDLHINWWRLPLISGAQLGTDSSLLLTLLRRCPRLTELLQVDWFSLGKWTALLQTVLSFFHSSVHPLTLALTQSIRVCVVICTRCVKKF